jgi:hypothetical protein
MDEVTRQYRHVRIPAIGRLRYLVWGLNLILAVGIILVIVGATLHNYALILTGGMLVVSRAIFHTIALRYIRKRLRALSATQPKPEQP